MLNPRPVASKVKRLALSALMLCAAGASASFAQPETETVPSLEIYSEFQRTDPFGNIVAADRSPHPREILSPAVVRNAFATFHVVVTLPRGTNYLLYVAPNPVNACRVEMYKEHFVRSGDRWIPDTLTKLQRLPDFGFIPDPDESIAGQNTRSYLLDLWIPPDADLKGFRLEVQLKIGYFLVRPMEVRVLGARVPDLPASWTGEPAALPDVSAPADAAALGPLTQYFSTGQAAPVREPATVRAFLARNAVQDVALAASLDPQRAGPEALKRFRDTIPRNLGAEWYLRLRDHLYAEASRR